MMNLYNMAEQVADWKTTGFRKKVVGSIEEVMNQTHNPLQRTSIEMENHVFTKAKTKSEYMSLVAKVIIHLRELDKNQSKQKQLKQQQVRGQNQILQQQAAPAAQQQQPMPPNIQQQQQQMHNVSQMKQMPHQINVMEAPRMMQAGQTAQNFLQQSRQQKTGSPMAVNQSPQVTSANNGVRQLGTATPTHMVIGGGAGAGGGAPQQQVTSAPGVRPPMTSTPSTAITPAVHAGQASSTQVLTQQQLQQQHQLQQQQQQQMQQRHMNQQQANFNTNNSNNMTIVRPGQKAYLSNGQLVNISGSPAPQGQHLPIIRLPIINPSANLQQFPAEQRYTVAGGVAGGVVTAMPSSNPQLVNSQQQPQSSQQQQQQQQQQQGGAQSNAQANTQEIEYMEKWKQLQKFVEPLKRMIVKIEHDKDREKDLSKMKNMLIILTDPTKRIANPYAALLKCEHVLMKLDLHQKVSKSHKGAYTSTTTTTTTTTTATTTANDASSSIPASSVPDTQHMCQPLMDAVATHIASTPDINHILYKTFRPTAQLLRTTDLGNSIVGENIDYSHDIHAKIENPYTENVAKEIGHLHSRFKVGLDPMKVPGNTDCYIVVAVEESLLPNVPLLSITIPSTYPNDSPAVNFDDIYDNTPYLRNLKITFKDIVTKLPNNFSLTLLLDAWEQSIRKAEISVPVKKIENDENIEQLCRINVM